MYNHILGASLKRPPPPVLGYCQIIANYWQFKCRFLHAFAVVCKVENRGGFRNLMMISSKQWYLVGYAVFKNHNNPVSNPGEGTI